MAPIGWFALAMIGAPASRSTLLAGLGGAWSRRCAAALTALTLASCAGTPTDRPSAAQSDERRLFVEADESILEYHIQQVQPEQLALTVTGEETVAPGEGLNTVSEPEPSLTVSDAVDVSSEGEGSDGRAPQAQRNATQRRKDRVMGRTLSRTRARAASEGRGL